MPFSDVEEMQIKEILTFVEKFGIELDERAFKAFDKVRSLQV